MTTTTTVPATATPAPMESQPEARPRPRWERPALLVLLAYGAQQMARPYQVGEVLPLTLDPLYLPYYLLRTTLRMFLALGASLVFSCVFAALATKYRTAEKVLRAIKAQGGARPQARR